MLKGIDTSALAFITQLYPEATSAATCATAVDLSKYTHATLVVSVASTAAAFIDVDVLRSSASGGTFHNFGASISARIKNQRYVRSFILGSSDVWYKAYYTQLGAGSPAVDISFVAAGVREAPIDQPSGTTSYSVINSA
jgi:hypothetical protein